MRAEGIFIAVEVDDSVASDPEMAARLAEVCPVDIFAVGDTGTLELVDANVVEDEPLARVEAHAQAPLLPAHLVATDRERGSLGLRHVERPHVRAPGGVRGLGREVAVVVDAQGG